MCRQVRVGPHRVARADPLPGCVIQVADQPYPVTGQERRPAGLTASVPAAGLKGTVRDLNTTAKTFLLEGFTVDYSAAKGAVINLTKTMAKELAPHITVNAVAPGFIATAMTDALPEKAREELITQIPLERLGTADDIANAVVFLATDASGYITGQVLAVNGGMYM